MGETLQRDPMDKVTDYHQEYSGTPDTKPSHPLKILRLFMSNERADRIMDRFTRPGKHSLAAQAQQQKEETFVVPRAPVEAPAITSYALNTIIKPGDQPKEATSAVRAFEPGELDRRADAEKASLQQNLARQNADPNMLTEEDLGTTESEAFNPRNTPDYQPRHDSGQTSQSTNDHQPAHADK